jgi:hypothetical protein
MKVKKGPGPFFLLKKRPGPGESKIKGKYFSWFNNLQERGPIILPYSTAATLGLIQPYTSLTVLLAVVGQRPLMFLVFFLIADRASFFFIFIFFFAKKR